MPFTIEFMTSSITADNWVQQYQIILPTDGESFVSA